MHIGAELNKYCMNKTGQHHHHEHGALVRGTAKAAQVYPEDLCRAICRGLKKQKEATGQGRYVLGTVGREESLEMARAWEGAVHNSNKQDHRRRKQLLGHLGLFGVDEDWKQEPIPPEEASEEDWKTFFDDVSGPQLQPRLLQGRKQSQSPLQHLQLQQLPL